MILSLPLVPKGVPWNPPKKTNFPTEFCNEICTVYVRTIKIIILERKNENVVPFQNGGQITDFYFVSFRFWPNFEKKNTFLKKFFNKIWLKVGEHEKIYITKITFKNIWILHFDNNVNLR